MLRLLSALMGPVFAKEMVEMARRKRYYLNRVLYGLALLLTLFMVWDRYRWQVERLGGVTIRLMAEMAEALFHGISGLQYTAVYLLVPLFLCGAVASEREGQTLELLFTTQLKDREIVLGKLASRVAAFVLLILCALPVISLLQFFGGIDPDAVWRILAVTLLAILFAGAHALYFSVVTRSPVGALVRTYWWLAFWLLLVPMGVMIAVTLYLGPARRGPSGVEQLCLTFFALTNPFFAFMTVLDTFTYNQIAALLPGFFPLSFIAPGGWSLFLIWRAVRRLRLAPTPFARLLGRVPLAQRFRKWRQQRAEARARRRQFRSERVWFLFPARNPLWVRARRVRVYDREGYLGRIQWLGWAVAGIFLAMILLLDRVDHFDSGSAMGFASFTWIGVAALAAILAGSSLVSDRRRGFLDLILVTPLSAREVIDGTLLAVWQHWRRAYWLPVALGLVFYVTGASSGVGVLCSLLTATLCCLLLLVHGIACSLTARSLPGALVPTFLFPLLVNVGIVFLIPMFEEASGPVLWFLSLVFLVVTWTWTRLRTSAAAVGSHFMAVHLALVGLATCWTVAWGPSGPKGEYPILVMHPGVLTIAPLEHRHEWFWRGPPAFYVFACYWAALVVNIVWARRWLLVRFERLTGRTRPEAAVPASRLRRPWRRVVREPAAVASGGREPPVGATGDGRVEQGAHAPRSPP